MSDEGKGTPVRLGDGQDYRIPAYGIGSPWGLEMAELLDQYDAVLLSKSVEPARVKIDAIIEQIVRLALSQNYDNDQIELLLSKGYVGVDKASEIINAVQGMTSPNE